MILIIIGIGTDIIEISRIEKAISKKNFLEKTFTDNEIQDYLKRGSKPEILAGYFAAKESVSKALGTGFRGFSFKDIEILKDNLSKPYVNLSEKIQCNNAIIHISISHSKGNAISFCVIESK